MSSDIKTSISFAPNGPILVKDLPQLSNQQGPLEITETTALCRCGASANKPFCDGSHAKIQFSSDKLDDRVKDKRDTYHGVEITIHDNRSICAHAGYCTDNLSDVFRMKQEPWIDPDAATNDEIIAAITKCPSGALSYSIDNIERTEQDSQTAIFIAKNGPYVVTGDTDLLEISGEGAARKQLTLCRCGASRNKPFCDGSHWDSHFNDDKN